MAQVDSFQVTFQKRSIQGLDQYEHEQASLTTNVTIEDPNEDIDKAVENVAASVRSRVYQMLGLATPTLPGPGKATPAETEKTPAHPASSGSSGGQSKTTASNLGSGNGGQYVATAGPTDANGKPVAPEKTSGVRGDNATALAKHLMAVHDAGNPVPDAQINRLTKLWANEVRNYIQKSSDDAREPAGSHDDPPVTPSNVDQGSGGSSGMNDDTDPLEGAEPDQAELKREAEAQDAAKHAPDPLEGAGGDTPDPAPASGSGGQDDGDPLDDIMGSPAAPQHRDISDDELHEQLRQYGARFGKDNGHLVKQIFRRYTNGRPGDVPGSERPKLLDEIEAKAKELGV